MSNLPSQLWEGNHCAALLVLPREHPATQSSCPCSREALQHGQMIASCHSSLQVDLKMAMVFHNNGGEPLPAFLIGQGGSGGAA